MMIDQMIMEARSMGCSDIHITVGMPLMYRINGRLQNAPTNPIDSLKQILERFVFFHEMKRSRMTCDTISRRECQK